MQRPREEEVTLTRQQVRAVDKIAIEQFQIPGIVLMENAAIHAAAIAWKMLDKKPSPVTIVCGGGNNGGDGLAIARHLHNRGCAIRIVLTGDPAHYQGDALINWNIVRAMGLAPSNFGSADAIHPPAALIIDAIFGTGLSKAPRGNFANFARAMNEAGVPVLAIDLPSGMDCDTGEPLGECVKATVTVTFVAGKIGFDNPASRQYTGAVHVADIGAPKAAILLAQVMDKSPI